MLHTYGMVALIDGLSIEITIKGSVVGDEKNIKVFIVLDNIRHMCELDALEACCIYVYIWRLYKECKKTSLLKKFKFVDPYSMSHDLKVDSAKKARILASRMCGTLTNQFLLMPCNVGWHWILLVIDPHNDTTYVLDPLKEDRHFTEIKIVTETAIKMFNKNIGKRGRQSHAWEVIKCHQQPHGSVQCGFYIMRYMKDIIENYGCDRSKPISSLFVEGFYSEEEINEVREEWVEFVYRFVHKNDDEGSS
ncbi:uncharacterized protein LOC130998419 [Salvia miltiorrhiza]|uniref:uncharacterized protein LOC130998419 n=1 Tax=Salvia miltiorrhiza TaxID=226208 RepID=UPI0025AD2124|nr:uncharacterized protein LOC130998419 [Salvia miltiorrhiza]